jgi:hypothetical protein
MEKCRLTYQEDMKMRLWIQDRVQILSYFILILVFNLNHIPFCFLTFNINSKTPNNVARVSINPSFKSNVTLNSERDCETFLGQSRIKRIIINSSVGIRNSACINVSEVGIWINPSMKLKLSGEIISKVCQLLDALNGVCMMIVFHWLINHYHHQSKLNPFLYIFTFFSIKFKFKELDDECSFSFKHSFLLDQHFDSLWNIQVH